MIMSDLRSFLSPRSTDKNITKNVASQKRVWYYVIVVNDINNLDR